MLTMIRCVRRDLKELYKGSVRLYLSSEENENEKKESIRLKEFRQKLQEKLPVDKILATREAKSDVSEIKKRRAKVPLRKVVEHKEGKHPDQEKEPLKSFADGINPVTGEFGGPKGPEPTRYGDWERKGRVTDF